MKYVTSITQWRVFSISTMLVVILFMFPLVIQAAPGGVSGNLQLWALVQFYVFLNIYYVAKKLKSTKVTPKK